MELDLRKVTEYLLKADSQEGEDIGSYSYEHLRMSGAYWTLCGLSSLNELNSDRKEEIISWLLRCQHENGGFGGNIGHDSHITNTHYAVLILCLYKSLDLIDKGKIASYISSLQQPDGSFKGDEWGESDLRFVYCGLSCLKILKRLDLVNIDNSVQYVLSCKNFEGAFGAVPGAESHAAYSFCAVGALAVVDRLDLIDRDELGYWFMLRQTDAGGFNGRPEKLPDICYSWWILSSMYMIERQHWINFEALKIFIFKAQDQDGKGGIADRPGNEPDVFHTFFGLAGLSLMKYNPLETVNPVYALPNSTLEYIFN
jgi:geranylgeranyl transferase type-2 subunit beta